MKPIAGEEMQAPPGEQQEGYLGKLSILDGPRLQPCRRSYNEIIGFGFGR
jgi:hypothetical protein